MPGRLRSGRVGVSHGGQLIKDRADPEPFLGLVPERAVRVHGVPGAPPDPGPGEVARGLQVGNDGLDGAFGEADDRAHVADPGVGVAGNLYEHVPVPGQQRPGPAAPIIFDHVSRV